MRLINLHSALKVERNRIPGIQLSNSPDNFVSHTLFSTDYSSQCGWGNRVSMIPVKIHIPAHPGPRRQKSNIDNLTICAPQHRDYRTWYMPKCRNDGCRQPPNLAAKNGLPTGG